MLAGVITFLYRRLGKRYPPVFMAIELQTAVFIVAGALALFAFYFDGDGSEYLTVFIVAIVLTECAILVSLWRVLPQMRPIGDWIAGKRDEESAQRAWSAAAGLPSLVLRRDLPIPIVISVIPTCVVAIGVLDLSVLAIFPLLAAAAVALGYSAILHYLAVETGMRPLLLDINSSSVAPRVKTNFWAVPLRTRLLVALPMINLITGLVVAGLTSDGGGSTNLGLDVLIALLVATTISLELTVLFAKSILRPASGSRDGGGEGPRGRLRRLGAGDDRRRAGRAGRELQPDGRRPGRARAHPRGVRHLPRQRGRRLHPLRGVLGGGRGDRGHGPVLRRARLHRVRLGVDAAGGRDRAQHAVRDRGADHREPRRPRRQVRGRRAARRLRRSRAVHRPRRPRRPRRL